MKERHIKTFPGKYGLRDLREEVDDYFRENSQMDEDAQYAGMPYLGHLRIDTWDSDLSDWWHESEDDWVKAKVISVDEKEVWYYYYDSHHRRYWYGYEKHDGFAVKGNVLIKVNENE